MPKRMVDTELWNDEDIIENFTAEDRYFWLYLLTNPHNDICGVLKYSPTLIARDMGYHKDCIVNLIYRFETIHKLIFVDKETKEIFILNWYKHNWTKSPKIIALVDKELAKIKSSEIKKMIERRKESVCKGDTVSIGYQYPPISNTIPTTTANTNSNKNSNKSKKESTDYDNIINEYTTDDETIDAIFDYVRFFNAKQGRYILNKELRTFLDNLSFMSLLNAWQIKACIANNETQLAFIENYYELQPDDL